MSEVIQTINLSKHYGTVRAVENLSLSIGRGEIYGFIGLNGAGKTTTIRMLLGMIRPTSGDCFLMGRKIDSRNYQVWQQVGYMVEIPYSYPELTVRENLNIFCRLRGISDIRCVERIIRLMRLDAYADIRAGHLSLGNAQRLGLAKALLHQPEILILDEPANLLDPAGIAEIRELLRNFAVNHGVTIFISSHILGEMAKLASHLGVIHDGHLIQEWDTGQLQLSRQKRLLVKSHHPSAAVDQLSKSGYQASLSNDGVIEILDGHAVSHPETVASCLVHAGCALTHLEVEEESLESYFLRVVDELGGEEQ